MTKKVLQIENIEADDLLTRFDKLEDAIYALISQPKDKEQSFLGLSEYLSRKEVASLFKISLVTVHDWTQKGILTAYKIGNKVLYKEVDVKQALVQKRGHYV